MTAISYTLTGQSKYMQRHTGMYAPIIKRPIHVLADGTAVAVIVDENDADAKFGTKNDVVVIRLYQSDLARNTWTLRQSYTLPAGKYAGGYSTQHAGSCLMLDESIFFVWRDTATPTPPGYTLYGVQFTKTGGTSWSAPGSYETIFSPADRYPFRLDLDINRTTGKVYIGWLYSALDISTSPIGVDIVVRNSAGSYTFLSGDYGIGSTGNIHPLANTEDFTMAIDPMSDASYTRLTFLASCSASTKDYGDFIGYKTVRNSDNVTTSKDWIKTGLNAGRGSGHRNSYMFATGNGEFAIIGMCGTTSGEGYALKYKTTDAVSATPTYAATVPVTYTSVKYPINRTAHLWHDTTVTYANGKFNVVWHDASYFRNIVGKFLTSTAVWETPTYTWDSFAGSYITITDTWRKAPAAACYGGSRLADSSNQHDVLLTYYSKNNVAGFDTAWAHQNNRPWREPSSVAPSASSVQATSTPTLAIYADLDQPDPRSGVQVRWQLASDSLFTTQLKTVTLQTPTTVRNTHLDGVETYIQASLSQALALSTGTWFIRAAQIDSFGTVGTYSAPKSFTVSHAPWAAQMAPAGGVIFPYGAGSITFSWVFQDAYVFDAQMAYRVVIEENDVDSTVVYDTGKIFSFNQYVTIALPIGSKNVENKWRVQLWDMDDNPGPLSDYALFTAADPPSVTVNSPADGSIQDNARPQVEWITDDPAGTGQASFRVFFLNEGVMVHDSGWRNGPDQAYQPDDIILENEKSYSMTVQVRDGAGLDGQETVSFTTAWDVPDDPNLSSLLVDTSMYDRRDGGYVRIVWENQTSDPEFLSWRLYRRYHLRTSAKLDDKGQDWELIYEEFSVSPPEGGEQFIHLDYSAPSGYEVHYTLTQTAVRFGSVVESSKPSLVDSGRRVSLYSGHYWLIMPNAAGFAEDVIRLESATADSYTEEYESEEMHLVGRGRHFELGDRLGYAGSLTLQLRFIEGSDATDDPRRQKIDLERFRALRTECWIRSPFGDLFLAMTGDMQFERLPGVGSSEFTNVTLPYKEVYRGAY